MRHGQGKAGRQRYDTEAVVAKLRRLADAIETASSFRIQIAGERIRVPAKRALSVRSTSAGADEEEIEFQLTWSLDEQPTSSADDEAVV